MFPLILDNAAREITNVSCGDLGLNFSSEIPYLTSTIIMAIKVGVPILLIIFGMMDLGKSVIAQKEDEIKKGQKTFMKRCVAAGIVFFVVSIVQLLTGLVSGEDKSNITECLQCFVNNECGPEVKKPEEESGNNQDMNSANKNEINKTTNNA